MGGQYKCMAFGSCDQAGNVQRSSGGLAPICPSCGNPMSPVAGAKARRGSRNGFRAAVIAAIAVSIAVAAWFLLAGRGPAVTERQLLGRWQAEETSLMGVALPVGVQLEFTPTEAVVLDQRLKVASYQTEGDRVHVEVAVAGGLGLNLSFRFLETNRMVYEGPMGVEVRYRRRKGLP